MRSPARARCHPGSRPDTVEPHDAVHAAALDRFLTQQLESELDEEPGRGGEIVDDDAHVVHPLDHGVLLRHAAGRGRWCPWDGASTAFSTWQAR